MDKLLIFVISIICLIVLTSPSTPEPREQRVVIRKGTAPKHTRGKYSHMYTAYILYLKDGKKWYGEPVEVSKVEYDHQKIGQTY